MARESDYAVYRKAWCCPEARTQRKRCQQSARDVVELDLMDADDATFDAVVKGCDAVMHTASPFFIVGMTEENVVKPAVEGTRKY